MLLGHFANLFKNILQDTSYVAIPDHPTSHAFFLGDA
jgi:hypothetical protein